MQNKATDYPTVKITNEALVVAQVDPITIFLIGQPGSNGTGTKDSVYELPAGGTLEDIKAFTGTGHTYECVKRIFARLSETEAQVITKIYLMDMDAVPSKYKNSITFTVSGSTSKKANLGFYLTDNDTKINIPISAGLDATGVAKAVETAFGSHNQKLGLGFTATATAGVVDIEAIDKGYNGDYYWNIESDSTEITSVQSVDPGNGKGTVNIPTLMNNATRSVIIATSAVEINNNIANALENMAIIDNMVGDSILFFNASGGSIPTAINSVKDFICPYLCAMAHKNTADAFRLNEDYVLCDIVGNIVSYWSVGANLSKIISSPNPSEHIASLATTSLPLHSVKIPSLKMYGSQEKWFRNYFDTEGIRVQEIKELEENRLFTLCFNNNGEIVTTPISTLESKDKPAFNDANSVMCAFRCKDIFFKKMKLLYSQTRLGNDAFRGPSNISIPDVATEDSIKNSLLNAFMEDIYQNLICEASAESEKIFLDSLRILIDKNKSEIQIGYTIMLYSSLKKIEIFQIFTRS